MSRVRAALRIARRDAVRAKGRSALVVAMVGVPMLALAFADVAVRTGQVPPEERARREIGTADLVADQVSAKPIRQHRAEGFTDAPGDVPLPDQRARRPLDLLPALPPGSRVTERVTYYDARLAGPDRVVGAGLDVVALADPMHDGVVRLRSGELPDAPGEVALTPRAAGPLGVGVGDTVNVPGGDPWRVTALVVDPSSLSAQTVYAAPGTRVPGDVTGDDAGVRRRYLVTLPPGTPAESVVPRLNELGLHVLTRDWIEHPPSYGVQADAAEVGVVVVVVGLAALEIVLLAGTALAVGARRRRRELALVAATGGDRGDVRRIVLAGGAALGAVAGTVAVAGGVLLVVTLRPFLERASGSLMGPLDLRPLELLGIVGIGTVTAWLAALLPARAASRQPVVAALNGRRGETKVRKRVPVVALVLVVAGAALAFWAAGSVVERPLADGSTVTSGRRANYPLVLLGASVAELGFVACAPALVAAVGALASRLPLSLRLAARDAARHRTRSGPAVAAVVAAIAGSVAVSVYVASDTARQRRDYTPFHAAGGVRMAAHGADDADPADVDAAVRRLPVRERIDARGLGAACVVSRGPCESWVLEVPEEYECEPGVPCPGGLPYGSVLAGPPSLVEWSTGARDERAEAALRAGSVVVFDERYVRNGKVALVSEVYDGQRLRRDRRVEVPAFAKQAERFGDAPAAVLLPETAKRYDLPTQPSGTFLLTTRTPTEAEEAAARAALGRSTAYPDVYVERGFQTDNDLTLLVLALAAGAVTLAATCIATGLAAADSRPDLATLAAIGAAPRIRRRLVMAQAATVAILGAALGLLAGLVPAVAVVSARSDFPLALPWRTFAISAFAVPLGAALLVGLFTRSRLPLERRVA